MIKKFISVIAILLFPLLVSAQLQLDWSLIYHPSGNLMNGATVVKDQLRINSQGDIICGWQNYYNQFPTNGLGVTSFNSNGNKNWEHEYYGAFGNINRLYSCKIDNNDNVFIMGEVNINTFVSDDVNIKYDVNGNQLWRAGDDSSGGKGVDIQIMGDTYFNLSRSKFIYKYNKFSGVLFDSIAIDTALINGVANEFMTQSGSNLYVLGVACNATCNNVKLYVCKTDTSGVVYWGKIIDPTNNEDMPYKADTDQNESLYILARTDFVTSTPPESAYICALDSMGDTLWTRFYNPTIGLEHCYASDILADNKGHVYVTANAKDLNTLRWNAVVLQYDAVTGSKNWEAWFDSSVVYNMGGVKLQMDSAGYIYMSYNKISSGLSGLDIVKLDSMGNTLWHTSFDTIGESYAFVYDGNGNFYCGGSKLSKFSMISEIDENPKINNFISIYPNPVIDKINIKNNISGDNVSYAVYDYSGRKVQGGLIALKQGINVKDLKSGMYILIIQTKDPFYRGKFFKN